jgi:hypothetical protein
MQRLKFGSHPTHKLHSVLAYRMSATPERDLISRSRDFRRDMVSTARTERAPPSRAADISSHPRADGYTIL